MGFIEIEGSIVILQKRGVYTQHVAYVRNKEIFVKVGSGYGALMRDVTSIQNLSIVDYDLGESQVNSYAFTATGRLVEMQHNKAMYEADSVYQSYSSLNDRYKLLTIKKRAPRKKRGDA